MKQIITIFAAISMTATVFAQAPNKMSYQAVIRNSTNNLIVTNSIGMQVSILQGTAAGNAVMRLEPIGSAPSSPSKGDMYFDSTLNKLRVYDGSTWQNC